MSPRLRQFCMSAVVSIGLGGQVSAQGTAFTYQGRLADAGAPANGNYDLRFTLFSAATGGGVVAGPIALNGVLVSGGLFTVSLDFGAAAFPGQARWLQIEAQQTGGGGFALLTPRQELKPSPYAVFSSHTDPLNLTNLNASNLTSGTVPSGALSGAYANPLTLSNPANAFAGDGSGLTNLNAQPKYVRTVVVSPVGTALENGTALLAALDGITTATDVNPWLLKIEPGIYDVATTSFVMKPFVDVEGSGQNVTGIIGQGSASNAIGTVVGAIDAELRFITVHNTGGAAYAKAIYLSGVNTVLNHVTAIGQGATVENQGIYLDGDTSTVVLSHVSALGIATGSARSYGLLCIGPLASPLVRDSAVRATGGAESHGVWIWGGGAPLLWNMTARGTNSTVIKPGDDNRRLFSGASGLRRDRRRPRRRDL